MAVVYPLLEFGSGVYATDTGLVGGSRAICSIQGLAAYQLTDNVGSTRALDNTIYLQYQAVKDVPISITFPLMPVARFDAIRDVVQAAITGLTTFTLNITGDLGSFTFTAKPQPNPIGVEQSIISGMVADFRVNCFVTD